jgi:formiminotetrahydrofolate cyclodeaminase/hemerythrin-like domain-containing protein
VNVRRHPHLQPLSDDHHSALVLARRTRLAAERCRDGGTLTKTWEDVTRRFASELEPHFRVEEERLFPQLESKGERPLVERARADHARLRELARAGPDLAATKEFAELLHRHVRFEERELFPRAESLLALPILEAAGRAAVAARKAGCDLADRRRLGAGVPAEALAADPSLRAVALRLAKRFAGSGPPAAGSAAAVTGAIAAGLLEGTAVLSARRGPEDFRKRAGSIASRATALQSSLSAAAQTDAEVVERWMRALREVARERRRKPGASLDAPPAATDSVLDVATRCAQVATLAAEVARDGHRAVRSDARAALQLASSAALSALGLAQENLRSAAETDWTRNAQRRIWRIRLVLNRARPLVENGASE